MDNYRRKRHLRVILSDYFSQAAHCVLPNQSSRQSGKVEMDKNHWLIWCSVLCFSPALLLAER